MRELKFRAWSENLGMSTPFTLLEVGEARNGTDIPEFDEFMQYTGLKDKNGVEIYEGNIVRWGIHVGAVEFKDGYFTFNGMGIGACSSDGEVIGNIYENPEILETK